MHLTADVLRERTRDPLPLPAGGRTRARFDALRALGREDLPLAKLVEPHHDALAIGAELGHVLDPDAVWAVWAAEPPFARLEARRTDRGWRLDGRKAFCSGADLVSHALVTADAGGVPLLLAVEVDQIGVSEDLDAPAWAGPGMAGAGTVTLRFADARAEPVGGPGAYVDRAGFWHGAVGVAAVWWGGAEAAALPLEASPRLDEHGLAHRGAARVALGAAGALVREAADTFDADPGAPAEATALLVRAGVADTVDAVLRHVGRATGPGPLAFDPDHARRVADLQVFVRQHHAERDLARLGALGSW